MRAFNENWNPWSLRFQLKKVYYDNLRLQDLNERLHKAQRIGTRIVGCLSENEIHQHHMRMVRPEAIGLAYIHALEAARKALK